MGNGRFKRHRDIPQLYKMICLLFGNKIGNVEDERTTREDVHVVLVLRTLKVPIGIDDRLDPVLRYKSVLVILMNAFGGGAGLTWAAKIEI